MTLDIGFRCVSLGCFYHSTKKLTTIYLGSIAKNKWITDVWLAFVPESYVLKSNHALMDLRVSQYVLKSRNIHFTMFFFF